MVLYLFIGSLFITAQYTLYSYLEITMYSLTNKTFLCVILYPIFIIMFTLLYKYIDNNYEFILREKDKEKYIKNIILAFIVLSLFLFLHAIIIQLICTNITKNAGLILTRSLNYDVLDIFVGIVCIIKVILTAILIGLLTIFLFIKFNNKNIALIVDFIFLMLLYFSTRYYPNNYIIDIFNPGYNAYGFGFNNKILDLIVPSMIYYIVTYSMLLILIFKSKKKLNIGIVKK